MENATSEEKLAIEELKKIMKDVPEDEFYEGDTLFYRFLKARDFKLPDAELMLREHLKWRKKNDVKNAAKYKLPEVLQKYISFNPLGFDKDGCRVHYVNFGRTDWIGLHASCRIDDFTKRVIMEFEEDFAAIKRNNEKTGKNADKIVYIVNMESFSFTQATNKNVVSNFVHFANMYQNNYPETLKAIHAMNASTYFYILFSLLKKLLPAAVINKFNIYNDDRWKELFPRLIDPEILPAFLGGKKTDPDGNPECITFIRHGETIPHKYYIHKSKRSLAHAPGFKKMSLSRRDYHEILLEVKEPDCCLEWEFETKTKDIGFGLFHEDEKGVRTQIIPVQRIHTDEFSETGVYRCERKGKYFAVFDNSYSIIRKKDIFYQIKVVKPDEESKSTS